MSPRASLRLGPEWLREDGARLLRQGRLTLCVRLHARRRLYPSVRVAQGRGEVVILLAPASDLRTARRRLLAFAADYATFGPPTPEAYARQLYRDYPETHKSPRDVLAGAMIGGTGEEWLDGCLVNTEPFAARTRGRGDDRYAAEARALLEKAATEPGVSPELREIVRNCLAPSRNGRRPRPDPVRIELPEFDLDSPLYRIPKWLRHDWRAWTFDALHRIESEDTGPYAALNRKRARRVLTRLSTRPEAA